MSNPALESRPLRIAVSGASGLIGTSLCTRLTADGHRVLRLVRKPPRDPASEIYWDPATGKIDAAGLAHIDAVVHLAGEGIAEGRWTDAKKVRLRESRVQGTGLLARTLASLDPRPAVMLSASAIGYYGDRADLRLDEDSPSGEGFLPEVCRAWEAATEPATQAGIRVATLRTGVVLSANGGALAKMRLPFKLGVGGVVGDGKQWMSWIDLEDEVEAIRFLLLSASAQGPVNLVAPNPVTNREFTKTLGKVLSRPTILPMPAFAARLALGEMADALLLASAKIEPARLKSWGYRFRYPVLEDSLRHVLK